MTRSELHEVDKLIRYANGELSTEDRQTIEQHVQSCAACREFVSFVSDFNATARGAVPRGLTGTEPCPDSALIVELEAGELDDETAEHVRAHMLFCKLCLEEFFFLRRVTSEERSASRLLHRTARRALITGITGQDGSYLAELLLERGYEVVGMVGGSSEPDLSRIQHLFDRVLLKSADLEDQLSLVRPIDEVRPHECYNLEELSFVPASLIHPTLTGDVNALGVTRLLVAIREVDPSIRFYQNSSSEMFGKVREVPQNELTPFYPRSPYGVSKVFAHHITVNYRESYNLFAASGILFNHESPRRGLEFVTRKVSDGVARIKLGLTDTLTLGNLDAHRDWGFAGDYVRAMWLMLQQDRANDYVIATGSIHSVRDLVQIAFAHVGLDWQKHVRIDPNLLRPAEVDHLCGNASKARTELGWTPSVNFNQLVEMMVDADVQRLTATSHITERVPAKGGVSD